MVRAEENLPVGLDDETIKISMISMEALWLLNDGVPSCIEISSGHAPKRQQQHAYEPRKIPAICIVTQYQPNSLSDGYLTIFNDSPIEAIGC